MGVDMERMEVDLQHLLKLQYEGQVDKKFWPSSSDLRQLYTPSSWGLAYMEFELSFFFQVILNPMQLVISPGSTLYPMQAVLNLFGKAKVNVNLLLHLLNAKFYGKWPIYIIRLPGSENSFGAYQARKWFWIVQPCASSKHTSQNKLGNSYKLWHPMHNAHSQYPIDFWRSLAKSSHLYSCTFI